MEFRADDRSFPALPSLLSAGENGNPAKAHVMRRADQNDALDGLDADLQGGEGCGGHRARVAVPGMRGDDRL